MPPTLLRDSRADEQETNVSTSVDLRLQLPLLCRSCETVARGLGVKEVLQLKARVYRKIRTRLPGPQRGGGTGAVLHRCETEGLVLGGAREGWGVEEACTC